MTSLERKRGKHLHKNNFLQSCLLNGGEFCIMRTGLALTITQSCRNSKAWWSCCFIPQLPESSWVSYNVVWGFLGDVAPSKEPFPNSVSLKLVAWGWKSSPLKEETGHLGLTEWVQEESYSHQQPWFPNYFRWKMVSAQDFFQSSSIKGKNYSAMVLVKIT